MHIENIIKPLLHVQHYIIQKKGREKKVEYAACVLMHEEFRKY